MLRPGRPVMFVHGLWKGAAIWDRWLIRFTEEGYLPSAPLWPGERSTAAETRAHADTVQDVSFEDLVTHFVREIDRLDEPPICVGHSFGALIAERLLAGGVVTAAIAIDPAQPASALPGSIESLRYESLDGDTNPGSTVVTLSRSRFRTAFTDHADDAAARDQYDRFAIPAPSRPLWEVADEGFRLIHSARPEVGHPLLLIPSARPIETTAELLDPSISAFRDAISVDVNTSFVDYGHALVFDDHWDEVADTILDWLEEKGLRH